MIFEKYFFKYFYIFKIQSVPTCDNGASVWWWPVGAETCNSSNSRKRRMFSKYDCGRCCTEAVWSASASLEHKVQQSVAMLRITLYLNEVNMRSNVLVTHKECSSGQTRKVYWQCVGVSCTNILPCDYNHLYSISVRGVAMFLAYYDNKHVFSSLVSQWRSKTFLAWWCVHDCSPHSNCVIMESPGTKQAIRIAYL